ncbi:MAG: hypothetical protein ACXVZ2_05755 [Gaiellaceae bacterium]
MRFLALIAVLAVAASIAAASAQTKTRSGHDGKPSAGLELTYTKWVAPYPTLVGFVGGDIVGKFSGGILERTVTGSNIHLTAIYIVIGPDPAHSFTAHVEGTEVVVGQGGHAVLEGRVVDGLLKHGHVHVEFDVISCTQAPSGTCFQGTISVTRSSDH